MFSPPEGAEIGAVVVCGPGHEEAVSLSPIEELRRELGLSISQFAAALGIGYNQLRQTERGRQNLPRKAWPALREIGVDVERLRSRQAEWFEERARKLREDLAGRISAEALLKHPGQVILLPARRWRERAERLVREDGEREVEVAGASA